MIPRNILPSTHRELIILFSSIAIQEVKLGNKVKRMQIMCIMYLCAIHHNPLVIPPLIRKWYNTHTLSGDQAASYIVLTILAVLRQSNSNGNEMFLSHWSGGTELAHKYTWKYTWKWSVRCLNMCWYRHVFSAPSPMPASQPSSRLTSLLGHLRSCCLVLVQARFMCSFFFILFIHRVQYACNKNTTTSHKKVPIHRHHNGGNEYPPRERKMNGEANGRKHTK